MALDFLGLSVGMGYTDETVIGGGALKGKNCVVSNIEEVADGVNVTFQWILDNGTVQTETVLLPRGTQGEAGDDGKSAYEIWLDQGNTGTEEEFLESLKGDGANSVFVITGSLDMENEDNPVILNQTFEEIKMAYEDGKTIVADILVAGEAQYIFNLLYILEDAIAFEWMNSAAKIGGQINLMNDNTISFAMTSFEGSDAPSTLVIKGNYTTDDEDNWIVSNINKTFEEINEAIINNQDVILKIYPEGDTTNPYILYPAMHYANMGTAFSLMVSDTGQISGLSVMITADNQVMASRNVYEFGKFTRIKTIEIPSDRIHKDYSGNTSKKVALTRVNDYMKRLSFYIEETFFTENNIDTSNLLNIYLQASGQQGGALMTTNPYGTSDIFSPGRSGIAGTGGVRYIPFNLNVFGLNGNSGDTSTEFTVTSCKIRYEE